MLYSLFKSIGFHKKFQKRHCGKCNEHVEERIYLRYGLFTGGMRPLDGKVELFD